jgi:hypothetical protein
LGGLVQGNIDWFVNGPAPEAIVGASNPADSEQPSRKRARVGPRTLGDKGDLAGARTRLKDLDKLWDGSIASSTPQTVARWRVIDRAINRNLDRSLLALRALAE